MHQGKPEVPLEQFAHDAPGLGGHAQHAIVLVEVLAQVLLELEVLGALVQADGIITPEEKLAAKA